MKNLKVKNVEMYGKIVSNQFLISYEENGKNYEVFQSYESMIIKWENGVIIEVGGNYKYSRTTGKYRNYLTHLDKKQFQKMLDTSFKWNEESQTYIHICKLKGIEK